MDKRLSQYNKYILDRRMQQKTSEQCSFINTYWTVVCNKKTSEQSSSNFPKVTTARWHLMSIYITLIQSATRTDHEDNFVTGS